MDPELKRRMLLLQFGRITEGTILEAGHDVNAEFVHFVYCVSGADYESSDKLTSEQHADGAKYAPGAKVTVRYDPAQPGNSIIV
jgi:Protein of unknown function (DUF3592)